MRKITIVLGIMALILSACGGSSQKQSEENADAAKEIPVNLAKIEVAVTGMTCSGCEKSVQTALKELDGVVTAKASHTDSNTVIEYDADKIKADSVLVGVIASAGYETGEVTKMN